MPDHFETAYQQIIARISRNDATVARPKDRGKLNVNLRYCSRESWKARNSRDLEAMASSLQIGDARKHYIRSFPEVGLATTSATQRKSAVAGDTMLVAFDGDLYNQSEL